MRYVSAAAVWTALALGSLGAHAGNTFAFEPAAPESTRAVQYATASTAFCLAELQERAIPYELAGPTPGVETPLRLTGPLHGVRFVLTYQEEIDPKAPATVLDCRLALAMDDLAQVMARHEVVEVAYMSLYRANGTFLPGVRHRAGRAVDVAAVALADGTRHSVLRDFYGRPGGQTCGLGATPPSQITAGSDFWRSVVCELDRQRSFNLVITPNYDWGHRDHLHLEVRSGIRWFLTQ